MLFSNSRQLPDQTGTLSSRPSKHSQSTGQHKCTRVAWIVCNILKEPNSSNGWEICEMDHRFMSSHRSTGSDSDGYRQPIGTDVSAGFSRRNLSALSFRFCSRARKLFTRPTSAVYFLLIFSRDGGELFVSELGANPVSDRVMAIVVSPLILKMNGQKRVLASLVRFNFSCNQPVNFNLMIRFTRKSRSR